MMDAALFVLLPKNAALPSSMAVSVHGQEVWKFKDVELRRCDISGWTWQMLPRDRMGREYDSCIVSDDTLMRFEAAVNGCCPADEAALAEWLLQALVPANAWVVAFLWQWEEISTVTRADPEDVVHRLQEALMWDASKEGFLMYGL